MKLVRTCLLLCAACGLTDANSGAMQAATGSTSRRVTAAAAAVDFEYDAVGNLTRIQREGEATAFTYDALDRPRTSIDPLLGETARAFDLGDRATSVTDPRGVATTYARDGFGDLAERSSRDTGLTTKTYDPAGNLASSVDARGVTSRYEYDALDRLVRLTHSLAGSPDEVFTWTFDDAAGGVLTAAAFPGGSWSYGYDALGRLTSQTLNAGGGALTTGYTYQADGHVGALSYPSGRRLEVTWEADVPVALALTGADGGSTPVVDQVGLDALGTPARWRWLLQGGLTAAYERTRDAAGRPSRYPLGSTSRELTYDAENRLAGYSHGAPGLDEVFAYDALDRLVGYTRGGASHALGYDATGNRTAIDGTAWAVDAASNRLVARSSDAGTAQYTLDPAGNVLGDGAFTATYGLAGQMVAFTRAGVTTTYVNDGDGRRVRKAGSSELRFVYGPGGRLLGEYDAAGAAVREYLWLGETLIAFLHGDDLFYVHTDHLGAPRVALDRLGRERWRWLSGPFGEEPPELADVELPLRFPGQYADAESGLFYNHFRYYEPASGRYLQADPVGLAGGLNPYAYVSGNPVMRVDPLGLFEMPYERQIPSDAAFGTEADYPTYNVSNEAVRQALADTAVTAVTAGLGPLSGAGALAARASWATRPSAIRRAMQGMEAEGFSMGQNFIYRDRVRDYFLMSCRARSVGGRGPDGSPLVPVVNGTLANGHHRAIANFLHGGRSWSNAASDLRGANYQLPGRMQPHNRVPSGEVHIFP